jgi:hypothetical protein
MRNQNSKIKSFKARDFEVEYVRNKSNADENERFDKYLTVALYRFRYHLFIFEPQLGHADPLCTFVQLILQY